MALKLFRSVKLAKISKFYSTSYEIPERYRNAFYLANSSFYDQVNWFLHRAYELCFPKLVSKLIEKDKKLNENEASKKIITAIELLDQCNSIIDIRFPIELENGRREVIRGFRAQHGLYSGFNTTLGGLRIKDNITRDHMKALSVISTYKNSCMGIGLAGAHGGIKIDPRQYKPTELRRIVKMYAAEIYSKGFCDGISDVIEPDINTGSQEMAWIASIFPDNYDKLMVVGKPYEMGGLENYFTTPSQAIFFALDYFLSNEKVLELINMTQPGLEQKTFIIQGIGTLGGALTKYLDNSGAICIGIKEHDGVIYDPKGIDVEEVLEIKKERGSILEFNKAKPVVNDDIFAEPCDILILAAQQKSLICYMADKVKAKVVVEAANGSLTQTSHRILVGRSKLVLPDIYVSSGHSVASYLEYLLNLKQSNRKEVGLIRYLYKHLLENFEVTKKSKQLVSCATTKKILNCEMTQDVLTYAIYHVMSETGNELLEIAKEYNLGLDIRTAGYIKAIENIHNSIYDLKRY